MSDIASKVAFVILNRMKEMSDINTTFTKAETSPERGIETLAESEATQLSALFKEKVGSVNKRVAQKFARYVALFSLASLMTCHDSGTNEEFPESKALIGMATKELSTSTDSAKFDAKVFELIKKITDQSEPSEVGALIFGNVFSSAEGGSFNGEKNESASVKERIEGSLPERSSKVIIRGGTFSSVHSGQTNATASMDDSVSSAFALSSISPDHDILPIGEAVEFKGFGATPESALQNGLEGASGFYGTTVESESSLESKTTDRKEEASFTETFDEKTSTIHSRAFYSYELSTSKKNPDGLWEVKIKAHPGKIVKKQDGPLIVKERKD